MRILCIGAHPDDIEFGLGGLVIKESENKSQIKFIICSLGEAGTSGTPEGRKQEAIEAAKISGVTDVEFLEMGGDCHIENTAENRIQIAKIIRQFKPDMVFAPELQINQHPDHYIVAQIAHAACRLARYGGLAELKSLDVHKVGALYFYPSRAEWGEKPDIIIDVSENYETWMRAMEAHKSQMKTKAYVNLVTTKASAWGSSIGVKYAIGLWTNDPIRVDHISDLSLSSRNY
jgi:LmbE family N-acetylglucosaminyl deacetylase